jgi:Na+-translocating ferredoxin:NAD+ oxidoreductase RnfG subunit
VIKAWLEGVGGLWAAAAKVAIVLAVIAAIGAAISGGIAWLRSDAAADATAACETRFAGMVSRVALDEAVRRAERAEAALRAADLMRARDDAQISELRRKAHDHEQQRAALPPDERCLLDAADVERLLDYRR